MAHELVSRMVKLADGRFDTEWLMCYAGAKGWHGLGKQETDLEAAQTYCDFTREIRTEKVQTLDGFELPDVQAVRDSSGRYLGTVGPDYHVHQDRDLVNLARTYMATGMVEFDTCGMLKGGSRIWISLTVKDSETEIRPGDSIKSNLFLAQGHDSTLAVVQGSTDIRIVCNNTLGMALREEGHFRTKHRSQVAVGASKAQEKLGKLLTERKARIEAYRFLAAKPINTDGVDSFIQALTGKDEGTPERANGIGNQIRLKFIAGIGNKGQNWWEMLNAVTEMVTHNLGNDMKNDEKGDKEGRALQKMFFGAGAKMAGDAFRIAMNLANDRPANAKFSLAA